MLTTDDIGKKVKDSKGREGILKQVNEQHCLLFVIQLATGREKPDYWVEQSGMAGTDKWTVIEG